MVQMLNTEQMDDDHKKEYCESQFDFADDKKKLLMRQKSDLVAAIADVKDKIVTLKDEIKKLKAGITALDKSVTEATQQRRDENQEFNDLIASNSAAKELLNF